MSKKIIFSSVAVFAGILFLAGCGDKSVTKIDIQEKQEAGGQAEQWSIASRETGPYQKAFLALSDKNEIAAYEKNDKYFVSANGKEYGPYDRDESGSFGYDAVATNEGWAFSYTKSGKWFVNLKGKEFGPYENVNDLAGKKADFGFSYAKNGESFININGADSGPFGKSEDAGTLIVSSDGNWAFDYTKDNEYFISTKEKIHGPYDADSRDFSGLDIQGKNLGFLYSAGGKIYAKINSDDLGPFLGENADNYQLAVSENNFIFSYEEASGWKINANGKIYGPYADAPDNLTAADSGWGFSYYDTDDIGRLVVNEKEYGPFGDYEIFGIQIANSHFGFEYGNEENNYINIDGKQYGSFEEEEDLQIAGDNVGFSYLKDGKLHYNVNGAEYGPFYFETLSIGGDSIYQLKISEDGWSFSYQKEKDGKWFVNVNGKEFGPYESIEIFPEISKNNFGFVYEKKKGAWYLKTEVR